MSSTSVCRRSIAGLAAAGVLLVGAPAGSAGAVSYTHLTLPTIYSV